jgi:shikimate dehydrogenase
MGVPYAEVIGDPVAHSKSPAIHKFWLERLGIEGDYRATRVTADELPAYLAARRSDPDWRGCNVTMPLKGIVGSMMDGLFPAAKVAGAVNTIFRHEDKLMGNNTDLRGFAAPFRSAFHERGPAMILGTGAAARTAFVSLAALDFNPILVTGRDRARAHELLNSLGQSDPSQQPHPIDIPLPELQLFVNASAAGMQGREPVGVDLSPLPPTAIVYDIVYDPLETDLLAKARSLGLRTIDGLTMLIGQARASFVHFFETDEPSPEYDADLRERLTS